MDTITNIMLEQQRRTYAAKHRSGDQLIAIVEAAGTVDIDWIGPVVGLMSGITFVVLKLVEHGILG